jgi:hypothetical protein
MESFPMTRISKQGKIRNRSPHKRRKRIIEKTGPKKDKLALGFKEKTNALTLEASLHLTFIPKIA